VGRENHKIALFPFDRPTAGFRASRALKDEEELAGGESVGFECAFDNPNKIGEKGGASGGSGTLHLIADVERKNATCFLMEEIGEKEWYGTGGISPEKMGFAVDA